MSQPHYTPRPMRVLIVEQAGEAADHLCQVLRRYCPEVADLFQADGIASAAEIVLAQPVDMIIAHIQLADGDGFALCRMLRAQPATAHTAIVLLGEHSSSREKILGFSSGADDFIIHPIDDRLFASRIRLLFRIKGL